MAGERDQTNGTFVIHSFAEVEAKARQVLKEKGFTDELIEAQLARVNRDYPDWPPNQPSAQPSEWQGAGNAGKRQ